MDGTQTLVGLAGVGLVLANEWDPVTGSASATDRGVFSGVLWNGTNPAGAHQALVRVGGELAAVLVAVTVAGLGSPYSTTIAVLFAALWILYLMKRHPAGTAQPVPGVNANPTTGSGY